MACPRARVALIIALMVYLKALKTNASCDDNEFSCQYSVQCVQDKYQCDGISQCRDRSDESDCVRTEDEPCGRNGYECANGRCINKRLVCDGEDDCTDKSDEDCLSDGDIIAIVVPSSVLGAAVGFTALMTVIFFVCYAVHRIRKRRAASIPTRVVCESAAALPGAVPTIQMMQGNKYTAGSLEPLPYPTSAESPPYPTYPGDSQKKTPSTDDPTKQN